jgi:hypothetical protein
MQRKSSPDCAITSTDGMRRRTSQRGFLAGALLAELAHAVSLFHPPIHIRKRWSGEAISGLKYFR